MPVICIFLTDFTTKGRSLEKLIAIWKIIKFASIATTPGIMEWSDVISVNYSIRYLYHAFFLNSDGDTVHTSVPLSVC